MSKYKLVVFDLDGTLLDTREGVVQSLTKMFLKLEEKNITESLLYKFIGPPLLDSLKKYMGYTEDKAKIAVEIFKQIYQSEGIYHAKVYPGILNLLEDLKQNGIIAAVATNKTHENAIKILQVFHLDDYFAIIQGNVGNINKKDAIKICMEYCQVSTSESVLIGDSKQDEESASVYNMDFLAVTYGYGYHIGDIEQNIKCIKLCNDISQVREVIL